MLYAVVVCLPLLGVLAFIAFLLLLIIAAIRKGSKKVPLIGLGVSTVIAIGGYMLYGFVLGG